MYFLEKNSIKMNCEVCLEEYNELDRKPIIINNCGHTYCQTCINGLEPNPYCPKCRKLITSTCINFIVMSNNIYFIYVYLFIFFH